MATEFSEDITYNIFLKLPVKSIIRCRSVCKAWRRLLCDPVFVRKHINQHHHSQKKLLIKTDIDRSIYSLDFYDETRGKAVPRDFSSKVASYFLGSCNGLLWIGVDKGVNSADWDMVLWNESTGDYKILPNPFPSIKTHYYEWNQLQGLGYCDDDYKIVRVIRNGKYLEIDVYTLKNNLWKSIIEDVSDDRHIFHFPRYPGTAVTGVICWLVVYQSLNGHFKKRIWCFDLENEKFIEQPLPSEMLCTMDDANLMMIEGLGISCITAGRQSIGDIIVWKMRESGDKKKDWIKMITISSQCSLRNLHLLYNKPLCWLENGKILFYMDELTKPTPEFALYDPNNGVHESYPIDGIHDVLVDWVIYGESLVSPNA